MTAARYDAFAEAYRDWWGPLIYPAALRLLDRLPPAAVAGSPRVLDLGSGTGALALAVLDRWRGATVLAVDASRAMLDMAAAAARVAGADGRLRIEVADAADLPVEDGSVDLVVSSFVIQLVDDRRAVLREIRRILRPGGFVANVSWLADRRPFAPDDAFERALDDLDLPDPPGAGLEPDPYPTVRAAAEDFRRAGFRDVRAAPGELEHRFNAESYLELIEHWFERERFAELDRRTAERLRDRALVRLRELPAASFRWRAPLVSLVAARG